MAIPTGRLLSRSADSSNTASPASASSTPNASGRLLIAVFHLTDNPPPDQPTVTGTNGLSGTWTAIGSGVKHTSFGFRSTFAYWSVSQSTVAGVATANMSGDAVSGCVCDIYEFEGADTTTPIPSSNFDYDFASATSLALALASFQTNSACLMSVGVNQNGATMTADGSLTALGTAQSHTVPGHTGHGFWYGGEDTTPSMSGWGSNPCTGFACEIAEAGGGGSTVSLDADVVAVSAVSPDVSVDRALDAAIAAVSALSPDASVARAMDGSVAAVSTTDADLGVTRSMGSSVDAVSAGAAELTRAAGMSATIAGTSALAAELIRTRGIAGTIASVSGVVCSLGVLRELTTQVASISTMAAELTVSSSVLLDAVIAASSGVSGSLAVNRGMDSAVASQSGVTGALAVSRGMVSTVTGTSSLAVDLGVRREFGATIAAQSTVSALLTLLGEKPVSIVVRAHGRVDEARATARESTAVASPRTWTAKADS